MYLKCTSFQPATLVRGSIHAWGSAEQQPANPMLSPKPYFTTYSPSPTTVSFTVSSHPPPSSYRAIFLHHLSRLLRLLLFLSTLSILILKYRSPSTGKSHNEPPIPVLSPILETQYRYLLPPTLIFLALSVKRFSITETLLVIQSLGIQTSSQGGWYLPLPFVNWELGTTTTCFIPSSQVRDLWIHEAFYGWGEVRCYLGVVVEGGEEGSDGARQDTGGGGEVVVVFPVSAWLLCILGRA